MPEPAESFTVEQSLPQERLDIFLHDRYPHVSRGMLQRLIAEGHIRVNGRGVKPTHHPAAGEVITVAWPEARPAEAQAEDIPLDVLYEDDWLLVLNKAPGIVVHPAAGNLEHTLVNALLHHCAGRLSGIGGVVRPGIVHRLDQYTSGCLVVAKTDAAHLGLAAQFAQRGVNKIYDAILCGELPQRSGEIEAEIARHPNHRKRMAVPEAQGLGRAARTSYEVLERLRGATLVQAVLHTGRTHQIRVHFQHIKFPLVGDDIYGKRQNALLAQMTGFRAPRQMLHARRLEFEHPGTKERMCFQSAWPEDFKQALSALRGA